ncbi:MAG: penicillin-binding protein activator [Methylophaga sp.]|nr:penicillin-binding protein activator [Methylophaga sp.]
MNSRIYLFLIACFVITLSACQPTDPNISTRPNQSDVLAAQQAEQSGDYATAAKQYIDLAEKNNNEKQALFYLYAAQSFWQLDDSEQASSSLDKINHEKLSEAQQYDAGILTAEIALSDAQPEDALRALESFDLKAVPDMQKKAMLELQIQSYNLTENWLEKANSHILLAPLLDDADREQNQQALWQALMHLSPQILDLFNPGVPPSIDSGWFALAYAVKAYPANSDSLAVAIEDWYRSYPNHPADPTLFPSPGGTDTAIVIATDLPLNITDIAILLPESGPYKIAAKAIREGIIAAHLTAQSNTQLHFLSVDTDRQYGTSNVLQQYQRAIDKNVSLIIGPLDKIAVQLLAESVSLPVPVLALNRLAEQTSKANLFQFGLAPEDDAIAVANYAQAQGFERAIILSPQNSWGERISTAFIDQWQINNGIVLNQATYDVTQNDFSDVLKPLLGLVTSKQRSQALTRVLGRNLEFEPRRRQDIDFLFLVAKPPKARQLVPQLKFYRSGRLPIIATSHAYTGYQNAKQDIDLNRLIIGDVPWVYDEIAASDPTYIALSTSQAESFNRFKRLYALGADAYHLVPELNTLSNDSTLSFSGATGEISIDQFGYITHEIRWGKFDQGILQALPIYP